MTSERQKGYEIINVKQRMSRKQKKGAANEMVKFIAEIFENCFFASFVLITLSRNTTPVTGEDSGT